MDIDRHVLNQQSQSAGRTTGSRLHHLYLGLDRYTERRNTRTLRSDQSRIRTDRRLWGDPAESRITVCLFQFRCVGLGNDDGTMCRSRLISSHIRTAAAGICPAAVPSRLGDHTPHAADNSAPIGRSHHRISFTSSIPRARPVHRKA